MNIVFENTMHSIIVFFTILRKCRLFFSEIRRSLGRAINWCIFSVGPRKNYVEIVHITTNRIEI